MAAGVVTGADAVVSAMEHAIGRPWCAARWTSGSRPWSTCRTSANSYRRRPRNRADHGGLIAELDAISLDPVKQRVHALLDELAVDRQRRAGRH